MDEVDLPEDGKKLKKEQNTPNESWLDDAVAKKHHDDDQQPEATSNATKIMLVVVVGLVAIVAALYFAGIDPLKLLP
jgi:hypothetical protein